MLVAVVLLFDRDDPNFFIVGGTCLSTGIANLRTYKWLGGQEQRTGTVLVRRRHSLRAWRPRNREWFLVPHPSRIEGIQADCL